MPYTRNRLFAKYGHACEIINTNIDTFPMFLPGKNKWDSLLRQFVRMRMASEISYLSHFHLRSQGAIEKEHYRHLDFLYMIHPFSDARTIWEMVMIIVFILQFLMIPLNVVMHYMPMLIKVRYNTCWRLGRIFLNFTCLMDCVFNFLTGYYDPAKKEVILEPKLVAMHYLKTYFFVDIISSCPFNPSYMTQVPKSSHILHVIDNTLMYCELFKFFRIVTLKNFCWHFAETIHLSFIKYRILISVLILVVFFHFTACLFLFVYCNIYHQQENMLYKFKRGKKVIVTRGYFETLYQCTLLICAAGYSPHLDGATLKSLIIFTWISSRILYIYLLACLVEMVMAKTSSSHKYVAMVRQLKEYMSVQNLPKYMQKRLLDYYEFRFQKHYFKEREIMYTLSNSLKKEVVMYGCLRLVQNVAFFKNIPTAFMVHIISYLKSEIFLANDVIVRANTPGDSMYFIATGSVAIFTKNGREIVHLEDGAHFGEVALVTNNAMRIASVIAVETCELYRLDRKDFIKAIFPYPDLYEKVKRIAGDRSEVTNLLDDRSMTAFYT